MPINLERLSILFVDDSPFIRSLVVNAFKVIGVGHVLTVEDGGAAIELLQKIKNDPLKVGVQTIDLIVSNWDMAPVDGIMLLRWLRRHKDSTNRFLPFMMLTAYTEKKRVEEARDLGAHEVLAKPFTIGTLADKMVQTINRSRQFVHTKDYFGPDRRRQQLRQDAPERRLRTDKSSDVEIIHG